METPQLGNWVFPTNILAHICNGSAATVSLNDALWNKAVHLYVLHVQAYLLSGEDMSCQLDHCEVSSAQCLIEIVQPGDLPVMMALQPRHVSGGLVEGSAFCCLLVFSCHFSISPESVDVR